MLRFTSMLEFSSLAIRRAMIVCGSRGRAFPQRRSVAGLAAVRGDVHHRLGLFHRRVEPLPTCYF